MKIRIIFVFIIAIFNMSYGPLSSDKNTDTTSDMSVALTPYTNTISRYVNYNTFFRNWTITDYLKLIHHLNHIFTMKEDVSEVDETYSNISFQRNVVKTSISSVLVEIFGGINLRSNIEEEGVFYVSNITLDPHAMIDKGYNDTIYSGALVKIEGNNIVIYKVLDVDLRRSEYHKTELNLIFNRWKRSGLYISKKLFKPNSIKIKTDKGIIPIKDCEFKDFSHVIQPYTLDDVYKDTNIPIVYMFKLSDDMFYSLYAKHTHSILERINIDLVNRVLFLLKKYIQINNKLPSLKKEISSISNDSKFSTNSRDYDYAVSYFKNEENVRNLILGLYFIYNDNYMYYLFTQKIDEYFMLSDIEKIYSIVNEEDPYITLAKKEDVVETIITIVKQLLGKGYNRDVAQYVKQNNQYVLIDYVKNYEYLNLKFEYLKKFFSEEETKIIVMNHIKSFITIAPATLLSNLTFLKNMFTQENIHDFFYPFINKYFDSLSGINVSNLGNTVNLISQTLMPNLENSKFKALNLIFKNNIINCANSLRENFKKSYKFLQEFHSLYFPTMSDEKLNNLYLNNTNTLLYLNKYELKRLVNILANDLELNDLEIEKVLVKDFKYLHIIETRKLRDNIHFFKNFLSTLNYDTDKTKNIIADKLYTLSYIDLDTIKKAIKILTNELKDEFLVKRIIVNIKDFKCLNPSFLENVFGVIYRKNKTLLDDKDLVEQVFSSLDMIFKHINTNEYRSRIVLLSKLEGQRFINNTIREWLNFAINNKDCSSFFSKTK